MLPYVQYIHFFLNISRFKWKIQVISDIFIQKLCNRGTYTLNLWHLNNLCKQHVLDMFYSCNFLVLNLEIIEQSVVILWVNWRVNKYFWQRFTCTTVFDWLKSLKKVWIFVFLADCRANAFSKNRSPRRIYNISNL